MKVKAFIKTIWSQKKYKTVLIICLIAVVFLVVGALAANKFKKNPNTNPIVAKGTVTPVPEKKVISLLDGMSYSADAAARHPLAVSVENHPEARPQSGLNKASIVYETMTEGGITRFLAIFGPNDASEIGPIRSARLFFMDWLLEYDAFFAHDGGNEDALAKMSSYKVKDLPVTKPTYWRDSSRAAPHNEYSNTENLYSYAKNKGYDTSTASFEAMKFKAIGPAENPGQGVEVNFSSPSYKVTWNFDPANNVYLRSLAGTAHKDKITSEQLTAKNIIVQTVKRTLQPNGSYGDSNYVYDNIGSGNAYVLRDGKVINATWRKATLTSRTKFFDSNNLEIEMNPGVAWYEVIPPEVSPVFI